MATNTLGVTGLKLVAELENGTEIHITMDNAGYLKQELSRAPGTNDYYAEVAASNDLVEQMRPLLEVVSA